MDSAPTSELSVSSAQTNAVPIKPAVGIEGSVLSSVPPTLLPNFQPLIRPKPVVDHQENQDSNRLVLPTKEKASGSPPSQQEEENDQNAAKERPTSAHICPKCSKQFSSGTSLRTHLANVYPCDQARSSVQLKDLKLESKTCPKCGKTFSSWQGLRGHLNRIKPCDQEKAPSAPKIKKPVASRTCTRCGKTFSSSQSLRIHMNRLKPCDQDKKSAPLQSTISSPTGTPTSTPTPTSDDERREAERKARARYQSRKAYLKRLGRLNELGDPPTSIDFQAEVEHKEVSQSPVKQELKRTAPDESNQSDNTGASDTPAKRLRQEESRPKIGGHTKLGTNLTSSISSQPVPTVTKSTSGRFVHRSNKGHGGDLLTGGCSCPPCVRRWARKLMNRMQQLEDEVLSLRRRLSDGSADGDAIKLHKVVEKSDEAIMQDRSLDVKRSVVNADLFSSKVDAVATGSVGSEQPSADLRMDQQGVARLIPGVEEISQDEAQPAAHVGSNSVTRSDVNGPKKELSLRCGNLSEVAVQVDDGEHRMIASCLQGMTSDEKSLVGSYSYLNDQILMNERAVEDSLGHVNVLMSVDRVTAMNFRHQVDELRESIQAEKSKRDVAAAALIAHRWQSQGEEYKPLLEDITLQTVPGEAQALHAKWAEITNQMTLKDKSVSELEKQIDLLSQPGYSGGKNRSSRSRYAELGELSSKIAAEHAAKEALSVEREGLFIGMVKSSCRIRSLVKKCLVARSCLK